MSGQFYEIRLIKKEGRQAKVWEGRTTAHGITIQYGTDGRKLRTRYIPLAQIVNGDTQGSLEALAQVQLQHGYQVHGKSEPITGAARQLELETADTKEEPMKWGVDPPLWFF